VINVPKFRYQSFCSSWLRDPARQRIKAVSYFSCEGKIIDPKQGEPQSEPIKNVGTGCKFG